MDFDGHPKIRHLDIKIFMEAINYDTHFLFELVEFCFICKNI